MAHITESTYQFGPLPLMPTPPRQLVPLLPPRHNPQEKKSNQEWDGGAQIWNTPGWRRLKGRQVHVCTCLKAYFSMRYYLSEGAASGSVVKTLQFLQPYTASSAEVHLPRFQNATPLLGSGNVDTSNNACRARPAHGAFFHSCSGWDVMYEIV